MDEETAMGYLEAQSTLEDGLRGCWHGFAIELRPEAKVIGEVGLYLHHEPGDVGDLGYALHPDFHHHGYATEAAEALLQYGFSCIGLRRITSGCDPDNEASYRVMERIGMKRISTVERAYALDLVDWQADHSQPTAEER